MDLPASARRCATAGQRVSRKRIARLTAERGLLGRARRQRKKTTVADPAASRQSADLLQRDFAPQHHRLDSPWCGDISYVRTWQGWSYVATVIDLASRRIVGMAMADHLRSSLVTEALSTALAARQPAAGLIFHSDSGLPVHFDRVSPAAGAARYRPVALTTGTVLG